MLVSQQQDWEMDLASALNAASFQQQKREKGNEAHPPLKMTHKLISSTDFPINLTTSLEWVLDSISIPERALHSPVEAPTRAAQTQSLWNKCYITEAKILLCLPTSHVLGDATLLMVEQRSRSTYGYS